MLSSYASFSPYSADSESVMRTGKTHPFRSWKKGMRLIGGSSSSSIQHLFQDVVRGVSTIAHAYLAAKYRKGTRQDSASSLFTQAVIIQLSNKEATALEIHRPIRWARLSIRYITARSSTCSGTISFIKTLKLRAAETL